MMSLKEFQNIDPNKAGLNEIQLWLDQMAMFCLYRDEWGMSDEEFELVKKLEFGGKVRDAELYHGFFGNYGTTDEAAGNLGGVFFELLEEDEWFSLRFHTEDGCRRLARIAFARFLIKRAQNPASEAL
jgi:hypothetical protein